MINGSRQRPPVSADPTKKQQTFCALKGNTYSAYEAIRPKAEADADWASITDRLFTRNTEKKGTH